MFGGQRYGAPPIPREKPVQVDPASAPGSALPQAGQPGMFDQVKAGMSDPRVAAALMQFGLNLMAGQPLPQALGGGAAAAGRVQALRDQNAAYQQKQQFAVEDQDMQRRRLQLQEQAATDRQTTIQQRNDIFKYRQKRDAEKSAGGSSGGVTPTTEFNNKEKLKKQLMDDMTEAAGLERPDDPGALINDPTWVRSFTQNWMKKRKAVEDAIEGRAPEEPKLTAAQQSLLTQARLAITPKSQGGGGKQRAAVEAYLRQQGIDPGLL